MPHGHDGPGENPEEIHAFADSIVRGYPPLARVLDHGTADGLAFATYEGGAIARAELLFTKDSGPWTDRKWETAPASLDAPKKRASAALPEGTTAFFVNLIDDKGLVVAPRTTSRPGPPPDARPVRPGRACRIIRSAWPA